MQKLTTGWKVDRASNATTDESAPSAYSESAPSLTMHTVDGYAAARVRFFGAGAANNTCTVDIYTIDVDNVLNPGCYMATYLGSCATTLGTTAGSGDSIVNEDQFLADTVVLTDKANAVWDTIRYGGGDTAAYSPADNRVAEVCIKDLMGAYGIVFVYTASTGTVTSMNAMYQLLADA